MTAAILLALSLALQLPIAKANAPPIDADYQWPQWRGPLSTGVSMHAKPPTTWSEMKNIRWKVSIPGQGHSTPVIWGDHIFITTAIPFGEVLPATDEHAHGAHNNVTPQRQQEFVVLALDRRDGKVRWRTTVKKQRPHESVHETGTWASNSPVTDGQHLFASFGSSGLYCLDFAGHIVWQKDLGQLHIKHGHGEGTSPAIYHDTIIINLDHEETSFVIALDKRTGKTLWKAERNEGTSWSTPLIIEHNGEPQVIIAATNRVRAYHLDTGQVLWECGGLSGNVVASPVASDGFVYVANSYESRNMLAIDLSKAKGDITNSEAVVWHFDSNTPYVPSPLLYGDYLYFLKHYQGYLTCVQAKTGKTQYGPTRLPNIQNVYASLVGADGRVYITSRNGHTAVVAHGPAFKLLANNQLEDSFSASPVIVGQDLFLRGEKFLYCIMEKEK